MKDTKADILPRVSWLAAAMLLMVAGAGGALYGALAERGLQVSASAVLFCAGALLFEFWKQNPR